jgi:molecular chaperone GrpE
MPEAESKPDQEQEEVLKHEPAQPDAEEAAALEASEAVAAEEHIAALEAEVSELKDQLLRTLAEMENVRRRAQRDKADVAKYAAAPLLRDLLAVADNLSRAVTSVPDGAEAGDERLAALLDGVKLTEKELDAVFERHQIVKLEPIGEALDPHRHEAMFEVPDPQQPSGTVVQVIQPGYLLHDRLLRPARVGVAKGGPAKPAADAAPAGEEGGAANGEAPEPGAHIDTSA